MSAILSVSELTNQIKRTLEEGFTDLSIEGEISNFKKHMSGHWYFSLKDSTAQINCTMWRGINNYVFFTPENGMKIITSGRVTVYPPRGTYQFDVRSMKPAGEGELQAAFERLKKRLAAEGLFDESIKKDIPVFPNKIGIISGAGSAAIEDMLTTANRRYPLAEILFIPTKVQGDGAAEDIVNGIEYFNQTCKVDSIIIGRGGGSLEDLWAFNEEIVARAVHNSVIPIISGVGHEIDYTIADFVADLRAPTPTAAMELATPDKEQIFGFINSFNSEAESLIKNIIENFRYKVENLINSYGFRTLDTNIKTNQQFLDNLIFRIDNSVQKKINEVKNRYYILDTKVNGYDTEKVLKRGFTIIKQNDKFVGRAHLLDQKEKIKIKFFDGEVEIN